MFCRWVKVGVAFSFSILFSIPGPNNYESLSNPATPQTVYGELSNSYHVGGSYQVTTVVIYLLLKFGGFSLQHIEGGYHVIMNLLCRISPVWTRQEETIRRLRVYFGGFSPNETCSW